MKYIIETTEDGVNETLEVDGNLYKKSGAERKTVFLDVNKKTLQTKWKMMGAIMNYYLKKLMRFLIASLQVLLTI